ncbi:MAG: restriction endonuclease [Cyanobacteria bacterium P01_H01_bin.130]
MSIFDQPYYSLFNPTLQALRSLGKSASVSEIEAEVAKILDLSEEEIDDIHRDGVTKLRYRLGWARTYLKRYGLLENSARGIWALTEKGQTVEEVDPADVKRLIAQQERDAKKRRSVEVTVQELDAGTLEEEEEALDDSWQVNLIETVQGIAPDQFERLCQRLLRELGFINVEVTGKTGDGGIDGKGILRVGSIISFHVVFQAKRYQGGVSSSTVRDFRGAMIGRADRGLIITTGYFTKAARDEALRDGAPPIDLIDGEVLVEKLKELRLGVGVELVEEVTIHRDWFEKI